MPTKPFGLDLTNLESSHRANFNKVEEAAICDFMASPPFDDFANKYNVTLWMMEKYQLDIDDLLEKLGCGDLARKVNNKKQEVLPMIKKKVYRKIYNLHRENDVYGDPVKKESTHEDTLAKQSSESTQATDMSSSAVIVKYQPSSRSKISGGLAPAFVVSSGPGVMGETAETTLTSSKDKSKSVAKSKARAESVDIGEEDSSRSSRAKRVSTAPITSHTRTAASASPSAKAAAMIKSNGSGSGGGKVSAEAKKTRKAYDLENKKLEVMRKEREIQKQELELKKKELELQKKELEEMEKEAAETASEDESEGDSAGESEWESEYESSD